MSQHIAHSRCCQPLIFQKINVNVRFYKEKEYLCRKFHYSMNSHRLFSSVILLLLVILPSKAVLKEADLESTLGVLRGELTAYRLELEKETKYMQWQQEMVRSEIIGIFKRSSQNSLMLYSQKQDNIFDLTYACHEATDMYMQFQKQAKPFHDYIMKNSNDIARYDSLIANLSQMRVAQLSEQSKTDRNVCLTLAVNIRRTLMANSEQMSDDIRYYEMTEKRLKNLNDYAMKRYAEIQSNIFINGGDNYFELMKNIGTSLKAMTDAITMKYKPHSTRVQSQWDIRTILFLFAIIIIYGLFAFGINVMLMRHLMPRRLKTEDFLSKRWSIMMATTMVTLAIILGVIRMMRPSHNFIFMASGLIIEYAWLVSAILISLILRLEGNQIKSAFRIYAPLIAIGFIVITFRIVLIPNDLVNIIFPPALLLCSIWQWNTIKHNNTNIPRSDVYYSYFSLVVFIVSVILSWAGYTLFSVQTLIWWIMQLTCILTITCISGWMKQWANRNKFYKQPITKTWFYDFCSTVVLPCLGVCSVVLSIYWAADVFNLSDTIWNKFTAKFIDTPNFSGSLYGIGIAIVLYFVFAYINRTVKALLFLHFENSDKATAASRNMLARNVVQIIVWGVWILVVLSILHVSTTWLAIITGGLSTGVGFASKDIIENIYYGISLMTGRVKIGDRIECDGYRGVVQSISYTSTMVEISDGSIMAFQNSQLFTKNYKNLTMNHGWECDSLNIGVAYGSDINRVRQLLVDNISALPFLNPKENTHDWKFLNGREKARVVLSNFGDSSVDLKVIVWVKVEEYFYRDGEIRECIYKTLNENNIEIPFPQLDLHQK